MENKVSENRSRIQVIALVLGVVWVWFGAQMGSATACGNNHMNYFVEFGWIGLITICLAMLLEMWMFYWGMELSRVTRAHHFSSWMREITYPLDKIFVPLFDVLTLIVFPVYTGSCLAGTAEVLSTYLPIFSYDGALVSAVILFLLIAIFGMKLLAKVSLTLTVCMVAIVVYFLIVGVPANFEAAAENWNNRIAGGIGLEDSELYQSTAWAFMYVVLFVAMQFSNLSSMPAALKDRLGSPRHTKIVVACTGTLLTIVYFGMAFVLFGRYPDNIGAEIYTLEAVANTGDTLLQTVYPLLLFCAFISTGPVFVFSFTDRWSSFTQWERLSPNNILRKKHWVRRVLVGGIFVAISMYISTYGFGFVTHYLFVFTSWAFLPFCFIPVVFLMPLRVRRMRKEMKEKGYVVTANEIRIREKVANNVELLGEEEEMLEEIKERDARLAAQGIEKEEVKVDA